MSAKTSADWLLRLTTAVMLVAAAPAVPAQATEEDGAAEDSADTPAVDDILPLKITDSPDLMQKPPVADDAGSDDDTLIDLPTTDRDRIEPLVPARRPTRDGTDDSDASKTDLADAERLTIPDLSDLDESLRQQQAEDELRAVMSLLRLPIVVAAKREKKVFDTIMSASVVTGEEIRRSGATSIVDIMRLFPGVLVREKTPGVASVHVRGFDAIQAGNDSRTERLSVGLALVMIDDRIVYLDILNTAHYGALPVAFEDIERVEVVRGPATAMHGPNAVTGVVHIITHETGAQDGVHTRGFVRTGIAPSSDNGLFAVAQGETVASWQRQPWRVEAVAYYHHRRRHATDYRAVNPDGSSIATYEDPNDIPAVMGLPPVLLYGRTGEMIYPRPDLAMEKQGAYLDVTYQPASAVRVDLRAATSTARGHDFLGITIMRTPLMFPSFSWRDAAVRARVHGWDAHASVFHFTVDPRLGALGETAELAATASAEKEIRVGNTIVRPGVQIRQFRTEIRADPGAESWLLSSGFVRAESSLEQYTLMAATRANYWDVLGKWSMPFEIGLAYKPQTHHLLRLVVARAYAAPLPGTILTSDRKRPGFTERGRTDLPLPRSRSFELGYRANLSKRFAVDVETYAAWLDNMAIWTERAGEDGGTLRMPEATDLQLRQLGITGTVQGSFGGASVKMFATVQRTDGQRMSRYSGDFEVGSKRLGRQQAMPTAFGGAIVSWHPVQDLHLNAAAHYTGEQRHESDPGGAMSPQDSVLRAKLLLHATVGYSFAPDWTVRLSYRNALDQRAREFPLCDRIRSTVVLGLQWDAHM